MLKKLSQRKRVFYSPINEKNEHIDRNEHQILNQLKNSQEEAQSSLNIPNCSTK